MDVQTELPAALPSAVAIGVFDGVHRGHRHILSRVCKVAERDGLASTVVTFNPHPAQILRPESAPAMLTNIEQRLELFTEIGLQRAFVLKFDAKMSHMEPENFVSEILLNGIGTRVIVAGSDFHFGLARRGGVDMLKALSRKLSFLVEDIELDVQEGHAEPISSTAIRRALAGGQVAAAAEMLGRAYFIEGEVIMGAQRGRTIGFPTANIPISYDRAWPADGVYAGWFTDEGGTKYQCAINIGRRPTFYEHAEYSVLEAHLLDFDDDLYGQQVKVEFGEFVRSERRFKDVDALVQQLKEDIEHIQEILNRIG